MPNLVIFQKPSVRKTPPSFITTNSPRQTWYRMLSLPFCIMLRPTQFGTRGHLYWLKYSRAVHGRTMRRGPVFCLFLCGGASYAKFAGHGGAVRTCRKSPTRPRARCYRLVPLVPSATRAANTARGEAHVLCNLRSCTVLPHSTKMPLF